MQKINRLPIFLSAICLLLPIQTFSEPANLGLHKMALERYYDSGQYNSDVSACIHDAMYYLRFRITQNTHFRTPKKLAIVLDIDETALSNYEDLKRFRFGGTLEELEAAIADGHDPAIDDTLSLYDFATEHHIAVFFISGRKQFERENTIANLKNVGYKAWDGLFMEPDTYNKASVIPFKVTCRKKIVEMGYDIILNVGDQYSDLKGGYADMSIKLPNPFYYLS